MDPNDDTDNSPLETYAYGLYGPIGTLYHIHVGDEYQAIIPSLMTHSEQNTAVSINFSIGLDIPVVWNNKHNMKNGNIPVPGHVLESWSEVEKGSFVLGLYIFRKDFVRLSRFIESKTVGDILAYYYGSFYRSDEYKRWTGCKKLRGKRCIMGQRIFRGVRQQEFLARLVPKVSQECQNDLLEVSRTFGDAKISLERYVFAIKALIGIENFIDAVAIGKGKQDLTGNVIEPTKKNQAIRIRPETPVGKACSKLTSAEIIQVLTGVYRLSKNRSYELFWEAVWPRLLARGWHSEQPSGYNYAANGKDHLVYLMPGVDKFSRKLVKGEAYFDSLTDVLNKVALDPQLIELDNEENGENETRLEDEEENGLVEKRKSRYLQPRAANVNRGNGVVKFTVVDTSLRSGKIFSVRELDAVKLSLASSSDESRSEMVSSDVSDCENICFVDQKSAKKQKTTDEIKNLEKKDVKTANGLDSIVKKEKSSRKPSQGKIAPSAKKRRRLTACSRVDSKAGSSLDSHVGSSSQANNNNNNHKLSSNLSFTSRCSSIDTVDEQNQPQPKTFIDLNYPHVTPEFENSELVTKVKDEKVELDPPRQSETIAAPKEQENGGSRRQSTRNRPPTARALEAIANGFLTVNSRKGKKNKQELNSRNDQNTPGDVAVVSESSTGDASSAVKGEDENGEIEK
ncbi:hypothetical protein M8C21_017454 [Ambrosia artemisiifolia]|uniref:SANT domain-containing protein n=1 Tax=Ambrosia artemisiifolia TaxID=4212 RepID=A0AAD5CN71_AMBAR|nr:hypothetical protein M8C21_017454 [Ambrosia artemisiifolia]